MPEKKLIWLASYPKSGNTWLRSLLCSYFYSQDGHFGFDQLKYIPKFERADLFAPYIDRDQYNVDSLDVIKYWYRVQQHLTDISKVVLFLKTHNICTPAKLSGQPFPSPDHSICSIYIVRDPRDVLISCSNIQQRSIEEELNPFLNHSLFINVKERQGINIPSVLASWRTHYRSWCNLSQVPILVIRYEDLLADTQRTFHKVLRFLSQYTSTSIDERKMNTCIESTQFSRLQKLEQQDGFVENDASGRSFFNKGKSQQWKDILTTEQIVRIEREFGTEMKELGY